MDELIRENPELEQQQEEFSEEMTEEVVDAEEALTAEEEEDMYDSDEYFEGEKPDEIFFTSDFLLTADDFLETAEYAYLRVANNSWILIGLVFVFGLSCLIAKSMDYLRFLPVATLIIMVTQIRRFSNTDKDIKRAYNLMQSKTATGDMHYHIEFGEYMHITNNGRITPKHDLNEIRSICESEKYWLLCLDQQLYVPVAKDSIEGEHPEEFLDYLKHCCRDMKKKKISKVTGKKVSARYGTIGCAIVTVLTLVVAYLLQR